jgi:outer membrane lipoprotein
MRSCVQPGSCSSISGLIDPVRAVRERRNACQGLSGMTHRALILSAAGILGGALLLTGCATIPEDLQPVPAAQPDVAAVLVDPDAFVGETVVWGGTIAAVTNLAEGTRLEIVSRPLGRNQRPLDVDRSDGRFIAFFPAFLDPQVHAPMREVTVRGRVVGVSEGSVGEFAYTFPRVGVESLHLWPVPLPVVYRDPYWDPWWGPWGPYWGHPWRRGWW